MKKTRFSRAELFDDGVVPDAVPRLAAEDDNDIHVPVRHKPINARAMTVGEQHRYSYLRKSAGVGRGCSDNPHSG